MSYLETRPHELKLVISHLRDKIKDQERFNYAWNFIYNIEDITTLYKFVNLACNKVLLKSEYYESVLAIASTRFGSDLARINHILCGQTFLNSSYRDLALEVLQMDIVSYSDDTNIIIIIGCDGLPDEVKIEALENLKKKLLNAKKEDKSLSSKKI